MPKYPLSMAAAMLSVSLAFSSGKESAHSTNQSPYADQGASFRVSIATATPPTVFTNAATSITQTSADLNSDVNPNGSATTAHFDWGTTSLYGNTTTSQSAGSGTSDVPVSQLLTGLTANTTYHYRINANNGQGTTLGNDVTFVTLPNPPVISTLSPSLIGLTGFTMNASVNPNGATTTMHFAWGADTTVTQTTGDTTAGAGTNPVSFQKTLSDLAPVTTYFFQAVGQNAGGANLGSIQRVTTLASAREYRPDNSTAALYHMDDSTGSYIEDYSGHNEHGAASGTIITQGRWGNGRLFNGVTDYAEIPNDSLLNFGSHSFTLEAWLLTSLSHSVDFVVLAKGNPSFNTLSYQLTVRHSQTFDIILSSDGTSGTQCTVSSLDSSLSDGSWHHIAAVVDFPGTQVRLYQDGKLLPSSISGSLPSSVFASSAPLRLGLATASTKARPRIIAGAVGATIDEVRLSSSARSVSEFNSICSISGSKYLDENSNGNRDGGEPGISNWTILLGGVVAETTRTDSNGIYHFNFIPAGSYTVKESLRAGWFQTSPGGSGFYSFVLGTATDTAGLDFGNAAPAVAANPGWNMISLPVIPADPRKDSIFAHTSSNAFTFTPAGYAARDSLLQGVGYWLKFPSSQLVQLQGSPLLTDTVQVSAGWNMIGAVTKTVATSTVVSIPPGNIASSYYGYNGGYRTATTIDPGKGYWIKVAVDGQLVMTTSLNIPSISAKEPNHRSMENTMLVSDADGNSATLLFGKGMPQKELLLAALPPPPPVGVFDVRFDDGTCAIDLNDAGEAGHTIAISSSAYPVILTPAMALQSNGYVLNIDGKTHHLVNGVPTILVRPAHRISLSSAGQGIPRSFNLGPNYPNPFNPTTVIEYQLPGRSSVVLKVFDVLGREVATLANGAEGPGTKAVQWDALDATAHQVPSGVYYYRLDAAELEAPYATFSRTGKMLLLR